MKFEVFGNERMGPWLRRMQRRAWVFRVTMLVMAVPVVAAVLVAGAALAVVAVCGLVVFYLLSLIAGLIEGVVDLFGGGPDDADLQSRDDDDGDRVNVRVIQD